MINLSKKILFITGRSDVGGGPQHLFDLAVLLKKKGVVLYIASPSDSPFFKKFKSISHKHIIIPRRKITLKAFLTLFCIVKKEQISVIHSHGRGGGIYSRLLFPVLSKKIKIIHTFHGIHKTKSCLGRIKFLVDFMLSSFATYYICVSEDEKKRAIGLKMAKKEKILVINNGIDRDHIRTHLKSINKFSIRKYWGMEGDKVILGTLARLDFQKGLDILLRFIGLQKKKDNNLPFKIYIAGDGEEKEKLLKMVIGLGIDGDVIFCGEISRPIDFLASLDIYISFSRGEGLPLSVLEAMSCSLPCLLSDSPGHRSIAMNGGASLFSLDSFDDFDRKMCLLTDSLETRIKWGKQALACVSDNYTLKRMGEQTLAVYDLLQNGQID